MPQYTQMLAGFGKLLAPRGSRRQAIARQVLVATQQPAAAAFKSPARLSGFGDTNDWVSAINTASSGVTQVANALQPRQQTYVAPPANNMPLYLAIGGVGILALGGLIMLARK